LWPHSVSAVSLILLFFAVHPVGEGSVWSLK